MAPPVDRKALVTGARKGRSSARLALLLGAAAAVAAMTVTSRSGAQEEAPQEAQQAPTEAHQTAQQAPPEAQQAAPPEAQQGAREPAAASLPAEARDEAPQEPEWVIRAGHEDDILDAVNEFAEALTPECECDAIRVESTQIVAPLSCGGAQRTLVVSGVAPSDDESRAGVVRTERNRWARLTPAPTGSAAPVEAALDALLQSLPGDLFVLSSSAPRGGTTSEAPPVLRRVAMGALVLVFIGLAVWSRRKPRAEPRA